MELPSIKHPQTFKVKGVVYEVVSYVHLTDAQAEKIVRMHCRMHKPKKKDVGKTVTITTMFDEDSVGLL